MFCNTTCVSVLSLMLVLAVPVKTHAFSFSTGDPDGIIGTASRPSSAGKIETETGDDFILGASTNIDKITFVGLLTKGTDMSDLGNLHLEMYRVFPKDSQDPPSGNVPTRVNSLSDVAFQERDLGEGDFTFTASVLNDNFTVNNTVISGINKSPNQTTGGEGPATGLEVLFTASL